MSNTLKFGNGEWYGKEGTILAYNDLNSNYKPLPFEFERPGIATRVNKEGLIEVVGNNEPRIDYKDNSEGALLLEPTRTNIVPYSEDFNNSAWNKIAATITPNNTISPDGTQNSDLFVPNSSGGQLYDGLGSKAASALSYTTSLYVKPKGLNSLRIYLHGSSNANRGDATFNLSNQTVSFSNNGAFTDTSASILNVGNGWYRCILVTKSDTSTSLQLVIRYDGSVDNISGLNLWGCQTEQGSYATSYIPTSGGIATRNADSSSQTPPDGVIGQTEGTIFAEAKIDGLKNDNTIVTLHNGSFSEYLVISGNSVGNINAYIYAGGLPQVGIFSGTYAVNSVVKCAIAYKQNDVAFYINGLQIGTASPATMASTSIFDVGSISFGNYPLHGIVKQAKLYNTRLSNSELAALTS